MSPWLLSLLLLGSPQGDGESVVDLRASATVVADTVPRKNANELRPQLAASVTVAPGNWFTARLDGTVEALLRHRQTRTKTAEIRVRDAWVEARGPWADVRAGYGRLVWGRLDELSPSDVINPLDAAKFFFEGRSEARLAVPFVRARLLPSESFTVEAILNPRFVRGKFDLLDEDSSPFNLTNDLVLPAGVTLLPGRRHIEPEPPHGLSDLDFDTMSGGVRAQMTVGRLDVGLAAYRGYDGFGPLLFETSISQATPVPSVVGELIELHPRFEMYAADFETVSGAWAWRGEAAYFSKRTFGATTFPGPVSGRSFDAGFGFDRRAGALRVFGSALMHREEAPDDNNAVRTDYTLIGSIDRSFHQERVTSRGFLVTNPEDRSGFYRGVLLWKIRDRIALELSGGGFFGTSDDTVGRFRQRDFFATRLRIDFR
jgi:hypothetical protein